MTSTTFRHYRVLEQLDDSTSGMVYKAEDSRDGRLVALKFLPFELKEDPDARQRFIAEAQAASSLDHPNICTVHEIDDAEDGRMFAALAYNEGQTLRRMLEHGPLPIDEALDIARQIAAGLGEAHRHGLVHRDLVPANILISDDGQAKILDFGLGKQVSQGGLTQIGWSLGTPEYMSPELIRGAEADATGDLWSLGVLLYEMITGHQPFTGANLAGVLTAIQQHDPPPVQQLRPEAPAEVDSIIRRLLAKQPEQRYPSCQALLENLGERGGELSQTSIPRPSAAELAAAEPKPAPAAGLDRTWLWVVLALLAAIVLFWFLLAGSADGSFIEPATGGSGAPTAVASDPALTGG